MKDLFIASAEDIQMQWDTRDGDTRLLDMSKVLVWMRKPCAQPTYLDFGMCGGYRDSFNAEAPLKRFEESRPRVSDCHGSNEELC